MSKYCIILYMFIYCIASLLHLWAILVWIEECTTLAETYSPRDLVMVLSSACD